MALTFKIIPELKLVESVATGVVTNEDILNFGRMLKKTEGFDPAFNHLADLTQITEDQVTAKGLKEAAENSPFNKTCRRAYITSVKGHEQRIGFLSILVNAPDEHLFITQDRQKAYAWLQEKSALDVHGSSVTETSRG